MKVGELLKYLKEVPHDAEVIVRFEAASARDGWFTGTPYSAGREYGCTETVAFMIDVQEDAVEPEVEDVRDDVEDDR